jgi:hypothetical protein
MKKILSMLFALVGLLAAGPVHAQVYGEQSYPLSVSWDVDGEAADADQVETVADLSDTTNYLPVVAQPDVCRLIDMTLIDADNSITAGTFTIVGTDCWGDALTAVYTFDGSGAGIKTFVVTSGSASAAYFKTITAENTSALTGEDGVPGGDDVFTLGYASNNSQIGYSLYGTRVDEPYAPYRHVNLSGRVANSTRVIATGTALAAATAGTNPFNLVAVGDLIGINPPNQTLPLQWRKVVQRTDADNVVLDFAISTSATGQGFYVKKWFLSTDPQDGWFSVFGYGAMTVHWSEVTTGANTGGLVSNFECGVRTTTMQPMHVEDTDTIASGSTGAIESALPLRNQPHEWCRFGLRFGTGDDADATAANTESVYAAVLLMQ